MPDLLFLLLLVVVALAQPSCDSEPATVEDGDVGGDDDDAGDDSAGDDDSAGTELDQCDDDSREDNDAQDSAAAVSMGSFEGLVACPGDDDWYELTIAEATQLVVQVFFSHDDGDVDVYLESSAGDLLSEGTSSSDNELLDAVLEPGTYFVLVAQFSDSGLSNGTPYSLQLSQDFPDCPNDVLEPNNSQEAATALPAGTYTGLQSCEGDEDWQVLAVAPGQTVALSLAFSSDEGDIDLRLQNEVGEVLAFSETATDGESVEYLVVDEASLWARVYLFEDHGSSPGVPYTLDLSLDSP